MRISDWSSDVCSSDLTLEEHAAIDAFEVQNTFIAQQVGAIDLDDAAQELFEPFRIKGFVGTEYKCPDLVVEVGVVVIVVLVAASRPAFALVIRSEAHTSELQSLMRISYAVFSLQKKLTPRILALSG